MAGLGTAAGRQPGQDLSEGGVMSRLGNVGGKLYRGEVSVEFVGRRRLWYIISGLILLISVGALIGRGLDFSVDFKGGSVFQFTDPHATLSQVRSVVTRSGGGQDAIVQQVGSGSKASWRVQTGTLNGYTSAEKVQNGISHAFGLSIKQVSNTFIGPTWGSQITDKAVQALIAFLIVIVIYLSIAFEWKMAAAAFVALIHDIVIATGIYALTAFEVSPATVIGLLTILGYSLYDTVVVFDKVRENTAGLAASSRSTYSQAANLALNQTLVRSINTSIIALLPVAGILFVGGAILGAGELKDLALVLFVGMLSGTYSSIFIATPVLAQLKEREPQFKALAKRVALRESGGRAAKRAAAKAGSKPASKPGGQAAAVALGEGPAADEVVDDSFETQDDAGPPGESAEEKVVAGRTTPRGTPGPGARPGPRQQPRRPGSAKRRPSGKKKRR
jgi:preprotein translocase subunit SecF